MNKTLSSVVAAATVGGVMAFAGPALGNTNAPIAQTGGAVVFIPMMGAPLTVSVELDETTGAITSVNLDPDSTAAAFTATKVSPSRVRFEKGTDGATRLAIKAKGDQLSVSVRSLKLDDLIGPGGFWSGDVFGTSETSTVLYTIGKDATSGDPTVKIDSAVTPVPGNAEIGVAKTGNHHDDESWASQSVKFTRDGFVMRLSIAVGVDNDDDDAGEAKLRFTLTGRDIQRLTLAALAAAPHSWSGTLCDGTLASLDYTVNADGTLTAGLVMPTGTDVKAGSFDGKHEHEDDSSATFNFLTAKFSTGDSVRISLFVKGLDAALATKVHHGHCGTPAADPAVNTPISLKPNQDHGHGNGHGNNGKHGKDD